MARARGQDLLSDLISRYEVARIYSPEPFLRFLCSSPPSLLLARCLGYEAHQYRVRVKTAVNHDAQDCVSPGCKSHQALLPTT